jgi:hypothetical protein
MKGFTIFVQVVGIFTIEGKRVKRRAERAEQLLKNCE